jgi:NADPH2:quinone reductase
VAAKRFGYDEVVVRDELASRAGELTDGGGFDVVVDPIRGGARRASFDLLRLGGRLIAMGNASGADDVTFGANELWFGSTALMGFNLAAFSGTYPERVGGALRRALEAVRSGDMRVDVSDQLPLDQAPEAHRRIESGTSVGKLVLAVDGG